MGSVSKISVTILAIVIAVAVAYVVINGDQSEGFVEDHPPGQVDSSARAEKAMVVQSGRNPLSIADGDSIVERRRNPAQPLAGEPNMVSSEVRFDLQSNASASDFLDDLAEQFDWSDEQIASNYMRWHTACTNSRSILEMDPEGARNLGYSDENREQFVAFVEFCSNVDIESEAMWLEFYEENEGSPNPRLNEIDHFNRSLDGHSSKDRALEIALDFLHESLSRFDETGVLVAVNSIVHHELYRNELFDSLAFRRSASSIGNLVVISLLCDYADGCVGREHPMVQRYCFGLIFSGEFCSNAGSVHDAIFQTTSPNNYYWYLQYYDYLRSALFNHRSS